MPEHPEDREMRKRAEAEGPPSLPDDPLDVFTELLPFLRHVPGCPAQLPGGGECLCGLDATLEGMGIKFILCENCGCIGELGNTDGWMSTEDGSDRHRCEGCAVAADEA